MDVISGVIGSSAWSQDSELMQKLDETCRKHLRPHIDTDGSRNSAAEVAWDSYCFELGGIFPDRLPDSESVTPFFQNLSRDYGCLGPIITTSYIEDLSMLWTEVHPALLEVKLKIIIRWLVVDSTCAGYSRAGAVYRLWTRLRSRNTTAQCHDHTHASRA